MTKTDRDFLAAPLLLLPRPAPSVTSSLRRSCSFLGGGHGGGARSWQEMEEPPPRFFSDIFPENHADLSWVPDR